MAYLEMLSQNTYCSGIYEYLYKIYYDNIVLHQAQHLDMYYVCEKVNQI